MLQVECISMQDNNNEEKHGFMVLTQEEIPEEGR